MVFKSKVPHANTRTLSRSIEGGGEKVRVAVFLGGNYNASIGMKPVFPKVGSFQLVKILNKNLSQINSASGERPSVLIFAIGGNDLSDRVMGYQHLPPLTQRGNPDLLWSQDFGLTPIRFVAHPQTSAINVPKGMILQDIVL